VGGVGGRRSVGRVVVGIRILEDVEVDIGEVVIR
jgi:hypothetical protein